MFAKNAAWRTLICLAAMLVFEETGRSAEKVVDACSAGLDVNIGKTRIIMREAHCPVLFQLADGSVIADAASEKGKRGDCDRMRRAVISLDGGRTWKDFPNTILASHDGSTCVLPDGTSLVFGYHTEPVEGKPDLFTTNRWMSTDNWKTITGPSPLYVKMSDLIQSVDDGGSTFFGPLFHGRSVALADGSILTTMYGRFGADRKFGHRKSRSVLVKSTDRGKTWKYVSTIASLHGISDAKLLRTWQDGFGEPSLAVMPDGKMVCVMRTGTHVGQKAVETYHDLSKTIVRDGKYVVSAGETCRPLYQATSTDGGETWSKPRPVPGAVGACPRLLVLGNGVLALSFGRIYRPTQGVAIIFSTDGGETWTNRRDLFTGLASGYTDMVALGDDKLLCVHDSVTAWAPKFAPDWIGAIDIEVKVKNTKQEK